MRRGSIRWTLMMHCGDGIEGTPETGVALAVTPPELAQGIASLIKMSQEYRDVGLLVTNVGPRSPAALAGIERGDVLLRYDGVPLETAERLISIESVVAQGETTRQVPLEAVRGTREITFTVPAGRLGITVSPLLHRLGSARRARIGLIRAEEDTERAGSGGSTLLHVPADLVPKVSLLAHVLQRPSNSKQRKKATALLTAAGSASRHQR